MKKKIGKRISAMVSMVLVLTMLVGSGSVWANSDELNSLNSKSKHTMETFKLELDKAKYSDQNISNAKSKLKAHEELLLSGEIDKTNADIDNYYKKNAGKIITSNSFLNATPQEKKELEKRIQLSESALNSDLSLSQESIRASSSNSMDWANFFNGDIVLVHNGFCPYGYYRHGGTYDQVQEKCITAQASNLGNGKGVIYEPKSWYNNRYAVARGFSTYDFSTSRRSQIRSFLRAQLGKPYHLTAGYNDWSKWSCVKLPWVAWWEKADINIAVDVFTGNQLPHENSVILPDSIAKSPKVWRFA